MLFPIAVRIHQKLSEYVLNVKAGTAYQTFFPSGSYPAGSAFQHKATSEGNICFKM